MNTSEEQYPEHMKLRESEGAAITIGSFLDWLEEESAYVLAKFDPLDRLNLAAVTKEELIGGFLEIDVEEFHREKDRMLQEIREANKKEEEDEEKINASHTKT